MPTINEIKELEVLETPILLFDCALPGGAMERWATHTVEFGGHTYPATLTGHGPFEMRAQSEDGIDAAARLTVTLDNTDSRYSQVERATGWKGARLTVQFVFFNLGAGVAASEAEVVFRGTGNAPESIEEDSIRLSFNNRLNPQRVTLPEVRIQKRCPWIFPETAAQREEAVHGGTRGAYSPFFRCGYSPDIEGGSGNWNGGTVYTSCDYTRASCKQRGMFRVDADGAPTRRFGGVEFVPSTVLVRGYGEKEWRASGAINNEAKYNDVVPLLYGTVWVEPPVTLARNDGNLTRMEVLLGAGELDGVEKIVVNDIEIPSGASGRDMTATGWYNVVSLGNRTGDFNLDFSDSAGVPAGDPYGSMAVVSVVVPNRVHEGRSLPRVQALVRGMKLPIHDAEGDLLGNQFTSNPAWILLDVLRRSGWTDDELELQSFAASAAACEDPIETVDHHGNALTVARYGCHLALRRRRSAADIVRGIRTAAGLLLRFGAGGRLECKVESTLAVEQPEAAPGSNASEPLHSGWPVYEFGDGTTAAGGLLRGENGEPRIRLFGRASASTPNRLSVEFQDAFNAYQQDSLSLVDVDDVLRGGQETSAALPALGLPNFDQASRILRRQLRRSVRGNTYVEFATSVRGFRLRPGDLITLTYSKEGLLRQPFRIQRVAPGANFATAVVTAQWHDDAWYVETAGAGSESSGRQPKFEPGVPRPLGGTWIDADGIAHFGVTESSQIASDGTAMIRISAAYTAPPVPAHSRAGIPLVSLSPGVETSGGTLAGGRTYYYGISAVDSDGAEGALSFVVRATVPAGPATNQVTLTGLSFSATSVGFHVYRGDNPQQLYRIAESVAVANSFVDTGLEAGFAGPPDENYAGAYFHWRWQLQGRVAANVFSDSTIGSTELSMLPDEYRGQRVRIATGTGRGQERTVTSHSETVLTVQPRFAVAPDASSEFVIVEGGWQFGTASTSSPAEFLVPNREGQTVEISGRSVNANGTECDYRLCPLTPWQLLGEAGQLLDLAAPPEPVFALHTRGDGTVELLGVGFPEYANTRGVTAGTLTLRYWDELQSPSGHALAGAMDEETDTVSVTGSELTSGAYVQAGEEVMQIVESLGSGSYTVLRGRCGSEAGPHADGDLLYALQEHTEVAPFRRDFFGSPASGSYRYTVNLPRARVAAAELVVTNAHGNSPAARRHFTATTALGLRTLTGGQINLQVEGTLAIEDDATPPVVVERDLPWKDVFAVVRTPPASFPIALQLRQDEQAICELTIPPGAMISNAISGFGHPPLSAGAQLRLDILSVGQTAESTPGADLTVTIRL